MTWLLNLKESTKEIMMNLQKLSTFLPVACKNRVWRAATLSSLPHQASFLTILSRSDYRQSLSSCFVEFQDGGKGGEDTTTLPIEDPQHIKKDISVGGHDNEDGKETYSNEDDNEDGKELEEDTVDEEASTLLKDHSGGQDQSSS